MCRGRNVCPANSVCGQIQKTVIESEIGNERALADSVKCTAAAPVARRVYNKSSLSAHFPLFSSVFLSAFFCLLSPVLLPASSFLSIHCSLQLSGFGMLKQNCGFINKSKDAQASRLHMGSVRSTKAVMSSLPLIQSANTEGWAARWTKIHTFFSLYRIEAQAELNYYVYAHCEQNLVKHVSVIYLYFTLYIAVMSRFALWPPT